MQPLLMALGVSDGLWAPYASFMSFELYSYVANPGFVLQYPTVIPFCE